MQSHFPLGQIATLYPVSTALLRSVTYELNPTSQAVRILADPERPEAGPRARAATAARPAPLDRAARDGHQTVPLAHARLPRGQDLRRGHAGIKTQACHKVGTCVLSIMCVSIILSEDFLCIVDG